MPKYILRGNMMNNINPKLRNAACAVIFIAGALLYSFGTGRGEMQVVLEKAVNICLQCIGIG